MMESSNILLIPCKSKAIRLGSLNRSATAFLLVAAAIVLLVSIPMGIMQSSKRKKDPYRFGVTTVDFQYHQDIGYVYVDRILDYDDDAGEDFGAFIFSYITSTGDGTGQYAHAPASPPPSC
jgi:hypothetical protein